MWWDCLEKKEVVSLTCYVLVMGVIRLQEKKKGSHTVYSHPVGHGDETSWQRKECSFSHAVLWDVLNSIWQRKKVPALTSLWDAVWWDCLAKRKGCSVGTHKLLVNVMRLPGKKRNAALTPYWEIRWKRKKEKSNIIHKLVLVMWWDGMGLPVKDKCNVTHNLCIGHVMGHWQRKKE